MLRAFAEWSTRRLVLRRRLPAEVGGSRIYVSPSAGLRFLFQSPQAWDPKLLELVDDLVKPGAVVWDVGANVGLFSFAAAHRAGPQGAVVAIEPDVWLVQLLRMSCRIQPPTSATVVVLPCAVAAEVAPRTFSIARRSRAANFLEGYGSSETGGSSETQEVIAISLDWLSTFMPAPSLIKIDVEGAELEVLRGAVNVLTSARPTLVCEVDARNADKVATLLKEYRYALYSGLVEKELRRPLERASWSTIALPQESLGNGTWDATVVRTDE